MLVDFSHPTFALSCITNPCLLCALFKPQGFNSLLIYSLKLLCLLWFKNVIAMIIAVPDFRDIMQANCLHALHSRFFVL